jgi:Ulp1 family protease
MQPSEDLVIRLIREGGSVGAVLLTLVVVVLLYAKFIHPLLFLKKSKQQTAAAVAQPEGLSTTEIVKMTIQVIKENAEAITKLESTMGSVRDTNEKIIDKLENHSRLLIKICMALSRKEEFEITEEDLACLKSSK